MSDGRSIDQRIALVERKLELRRDRMERHLHEARTSAEKAREGVMKAASWLPMAAAAGALALGFAAARSRQAGTGQPARKGALLSTLIAAGGTAARIALSPQVQALWKARRAGG